MFEHSFVCARYKSTKCLLPHDAAPYNIQKARHYPVSSRQNKYLSNPPVRPFISPIVTKYTMQRAFLGVVFLLCSVSGALIHEQAPADGSNYVSIGHEYVDSGDIMPKNVHEAVSTCDRKKGAIFTFGKCPDECLPFDPDKFGEEADHCAPLQQFGCKRDVCEDGSSEVAFSCTLDRNLVEKPKLCPGDKVIFDSISVKSFGKVNFSIDLNAPPVFTDIYILADTTGSMGDAILTARKNAKALTKVFGDREGVAVGVGQYRDESEFSGGFKHQQSLSENTSLAVNQIKTWSVGGGGDRDEANLVALYKIATQEEIGWRNGSRKFVVYFGDHPGHEPSCLDGKSVTRDVVADAMNAKGITVVAANFNNLDAEPRSFPKSGCNRVKSSSSGQATFITSETGGAVVSSSNQTLLTGVITKALSMVKRTYDVDTSDCKHKLRSVHTPPLPITLEPEEKTSVINAVSLKKRNLCRAGGAFECRYTYTESGVAIKGGVGLEFVHVKGC